MRKFFEDYKVLLRSIPAPTVTIFIVSVILMNLMANKELLSTPWLALDCGFAVSWVSFLCMDMICKRFGAKASIKISILALGVNLAVCLFFFAFSTVLSWNLFGKINANYLFGRKNSKLCNVIYTVIALVFIFLGTVSGSDFVWEVTDMFNNFIVLPNVIALFALTGMVMASLNEVNKGKQLKV